MKYDPESPFDQLVERYRSAPTRQNLNQLTDRLFRALRPNEIIGLLTGQEGGPSLLSKFKRAGGQPVLGGVPRLGIPRLSGLYGYHGPAGPAFTSFPLPAARLAAFDRDIEYSLGVMFGIQALAAGYDFVLPDLPGIPVSKLLGIDPAIYPRVASRDPLADDGMAVISPQLTHTAGHVTALVEAGSELFPQYVLNAQLEAFESGLRSVGIITPRVLRCGAFIDAPDGPRSILARLKSGELSPEELDDAARELISVLIGSAASRPDLRGTFLGETREASIELSRNAAARSVVMLSNSGALPLKKGRRTLIAGNGATRNVYAALPAQPQARPSGTSPLEALQNIWPDERIIHLETLDPETIAARAADVDQVVFFSTTVDLNDEERKAVQAAAISNPRLVLIVPGYGAVDFSQASDRPNAVLAAGGLGDEAGLVLAQILIGDRQPGGHLPVIGGGLISDIPTAYGYGLSYSSFKLSDLKVEADSPMSRSRRQGTTTETEGPGVTATVFCANDSEVEGSALIQFYIAGVRNPENLMDERKGPDRCMSICGFVRRTLAPRGGAVLSLTIPYETLKPYSRRHPDGSIEVRAYLFVGENSAVARLLSVPVTMRFRPRPKTSAKLGVAKGTQTDVAKGTKPGAAKGTQTDVAKGAKLGYSAMGGAPEVPGRPVKTKASVDAQKSHQAKKAEGQPEIAEDPGPVKSEGKGTKPAVRARAKAGGKSETGAETSGAEKMPLPSAGHTKASAKIRSVDLIRKPASLPVKDGSSPDTRNGKSTAEERREIEKRKGPAIRNAIISFSGEIRPRKPERTDPAPETVARKRRPELKG